MIPTARRRPILFVTAQRVSPSSSSKSWEMVALLSMLLLLLLQSVANIPCTHAAYIVTVPPKDEECFFMSSPKLPGTFFGNYDMLDDDYTADASSITSQNNIPESVTVVITEIVKHRVLHRSRRGTRGGNFKVDVIPGQKVRICVQNGIILGTGGSSFGKKQRKPIPDDVERTVGFQFSFEERNVHLELQAQNGKLVVATRTLIRELNRVIDHYGYMRAREAKHRETVEGTFSQLMNWTLLQGVAVIVVAAGQILYFRRFLEQRRYI